MFRAAVGWPFDPAAVATRLAASGAGDVGADLARVFLEVWDDPTSGASLQAVLRSAMTDAAFATLLREFITEQVFGQLRPLVDGPQAELRINLAAAQMVGVAVLRCLLEVEPLASAEQDEVVTWVTPVLTRYLGSGGSEAAGQAADAARDGDE